MGGERTVPPLLKGVFPDATILSNRPGERETLAVGSVVLVLNQNYEPLNVCNEKRAIVLIDRGKAEVLEHGLGHIRTPSTSFMRSSVIPLVYLIKRPRPKARLTLREIFVRDNFTF